MSFTQIVPEFIKQVESPVLPVSLVKTEVLTLIKKEPPESEIGVDILGSSELEEETISDIKNIDIALHPLCEYLIKSETVQTNMLETKHSEDFVKAENAPFVKIDYIGEMETLNKTEDTEYGNGQEMMEVQGSNDNFKALGNLKTDKQLGLNFSKDLSGISTTSRKAKHTEMIDFAQCYKTVETTSWEKDKEKIKVIKAPVIPVEPHEYTSLAKDKYVCNHCQQIFNRLANLKRHINTMHRKVTTMYKCPYCPFKAKSSLRGHIIQKHKHTKDIQWFRCYICEKKFKLKYHLMNHVKVHLTHKQIQEISELCLVCGKRSSHKKHEKRYCEKCYKTKAQTDDWHVEYHCDKCDYIGYKLQYLNAHKITHLKQKKISKYFYCYHCSFKSKYKDNLRVHISIHFRKGDVPFHCYICDFMTLKRDRITEHFKKHPKHQSKLDETRYKYQIEASKNCEKRFHCDKCHYKTDRCNSWKNHKLIHLKPEEIQYFHCYHCSYKSKRKDYLSRHIFMHFKRDEVPLYCYICDFMTLKRDLIIEHFKMHPEHHSKYDETTYKDQLEICTKKFEKRYSCNKCNHKTDSRRNLDMHKTIHLKPEEIDYFYCYHCSFKSKYKQYLKIHILRHFRNGDVPFHCYVCDFLTLKRDVLVKHFKTHSKRHSKCDEAKY